MYKNAGFENTDESRKEAKKLMVDGDRFQLNECTLYFCSKLNRFFSIFCGVETEMRESWDYMTEWKIKANWYDSITKPVPCRVSDATDSKWVLRYVTGYYKGSDYPFRTDGTSWKYAEPLTCDELLNEGRYD